MKKQGLCLGGRGKDFFFPCFLVFLCSLEDTDKTATGLTPPLCASEAISGTSWYHVICYKLCRLSHGVGERFILPSVRDLREAKVGVQNALNSAFTETDNSVQYHVLSPLVLSLRHWLQGSVKWCTCHGVSVSWIDGFLLENVATSYRRRSFRTVCLHTPSSFSNS